VVEELSTLRGFRKKKAAVVTAVRLDLETEGFVYRKWQGEQRCKAGDWVVDNQGDVYTIDAETFAATYREVAPGRYAKTAPVWAEVAKSQGVIQTKEGSTAFEAGDYLVYNGPNRKDGYAVGAEKFAVLYELDE
jgi:hypothetical protein